MLAALAWTRAQLLASGTFSQVEVIIVDDASTDDSPAILAAYPWVSSIRLFSRSGYGSALKTGFAHAKGDLIVFLDMDGTYDPEDLIKLIEAHERAPQAQILGERRFATGGMPAIRGIGNFFFTSLVRILYRQPVRDVCSGYRLFPRRHLPAILALDHDGLDFSLAMTLWSLRQGIPLVEVPVRYHERAGESKLRIISDGSRFLLTILRASFLRGR
jgi:glycosyltransferase involved in cell wall biosynthesis